MKGRTAAIAAAAGLLAAGPALADQGCAGTRTPSSSKLTVQVAGVRPAVGEVAITVYPDDKRRFLAKGGKWARQRIRAAATVRACFWAPQGSYAVAVYHDRDGDRDFDRTLVGLPAEGFGFSNDPDTRTGLPPLSAVRFRVGPGERLVPIQMKYLR
ncbi:MULTISPECIES: DUF2141 domain-containing protein [unclassified Phenylobacterium]|uniref:DUF2141 domain-containing protein n=1 Tax=unclassified Phenylobacterium TaxID=2640670 RepID=UPI00083B8FBE|nr:MULTISPECIES: DUF2141 domain-containing protein [unclassified Phenylobacterium]